MAVKIKDLLESKSKAFTEILYKNYRPDIDRRVTILDLSYDTLKVNVYQDSEDAMEEYGYVHATLRQVVREGIPSNRQFTNIDDEGAVQYMRMSSWTYFLVDGGPNKFFIVSNGIETGSLRTWLTKKISRDPRLINTAFGETKTTNTTKEKTAAGRWISNTTTTTRTNFDIGHTSAAESENLTSPLEEKILATREFAIATGNTMVVKAAEKYLQQLYNIQADFSYSFKNVSQEDVQRAQRTLGKGYVVLTLHGSKLNNRFSNEEARIFSELVAEVALKLPSAKGSNSIIEDLASNFADIIEFGKVVNKSSHTEHKGKKTVDLAKKVTANSTLLKVTSKAKNIANKPISLASLQAIINSKLGERIADNMGTGQRRDILNFRSGRFASTVDVERMSASREGMITAFYRYMKYPYATFEPGGQQGLPKSRDPKLLISKSIREIASSIVGNRMRAVSI